MQSSERLSRLRDFIAKTFTDTLKPAEGGLAHPYITPGGPYAKDLQAGGPHRAAGDHPPTRTRDAPEFP